jgi:hypothetical protein
MLSYETPFTGGRNHRKLSFKLEQFFFSIEYTSISNWSFIKNQK